MTLLVVGGTGRCGEAVTRLLRSAGLPVRVLTRDPTTPHATALGEMGVELVRGDLLDPETLPPVFDGVRRGCLITTPQHGFQSEAMAGRAFAEAAAAAGVERVIYQSVLYAETPMPHCASKGIVENELARRGLPWTALRAGYFLDTLPVYLTPQAREERFLTTVIDPATPVWWISIGDLAVLSAHLLTAAEAPLGPLDAVHETPMSFAELADVLAHRTGKPWRCRYDPMSYARLFRELVVAEHLDLEVAQEFLARSGIDPTEDYYGPVSRCEVKPDVVWLRDVPVNLRSPRDAAAGLDLG